MSKFLFENEEEFNFIVADTWAYNNMQNMVSKLVSFIKPQYLIEFGSGSGATSIRLAKENTNTSVVAVDLRAQMIGIGEVKANKVKNVTFVNGDLTKLDNFNLANANVILLMYSFKYIADPVENKFEFLKNIYDRMQPGAYLIIGDTFIENNATKQAVKKQLEDRFYNDSKDVFWNSLKGVTDEDIKRSFELQTLNREKTKEQIDLGVNRDGIYYVSREWMSESVKKIGFKLVLGERLNSLLDTIYLLKK